MIITKESFFLLLRFIIEKLKNDVWISIAYILYAISEEASVDSFELLSDECPPEDRNFAVMDEFCFVVTAGKLHLSVEVSWSEHFLKSFIKLLYLVKVFIVREAYSVLNFKFGDELIFSYVVLAEPALQPVKMRSFEVG